MTKKVALYPAVIQHSSLWKGESGLAYNSFYLSIMGYGRPSTNLTQKECYAIQKPVINAILPKMGISRKSPRDVVFGTWQCDGLGLEHITV
jgi:hypothetical protein